MCPKDKKRASCEEWRRGLPVQEDSTFISTPSFLKPHANDGKDFRTSKELMRDEQLIKLMMVKTRVGMTPTRTQLKTPERWKHPRV